MHEEYLQHFSSELSEDIKRYAEEEALSFSKYIFTVREGKHQYGYCTHCKKEFNTSGLKHNEKAICPNCKSSCIVKASGRGRGKMIDEAIFEYYEKSIINPSIIIAREIRITKDYRKGYRNTKPYYSTLALYVFEMSKSVMLKRNYWGEDFYITGSVYSNVTGYLGKIPYKCCYYSIENAVKGTPFQYSPWDSYSNNDSMVKFFDFYSKYPSIEYLTKEGFEELVIDKLRGRSTYSAVNWKANSIFKILRLNKAYLKELRTCKYKDDSLFLRLYQFSIKDKSNLSFEEIKEIQDNLAYTHFREVQSVHKYVSLRKILNYTKQQVKKYPEQFNYKYSVIIAWKDYIADCIKLEMNLKDGQILFPKNLYTAHQSTISQVKVKVSEQFNLKIVKRAKALEKYKFEHNGLLIRPVESSKELIKEGEVLHHCVGRYAERYDNGETNIFVIRKADKLDKPYFTLELRKNVIIQIRGKNNCNSDEAVNEFIKVFKDEKLSEKKSKSRISVPA